MPEHQWEGAFAHNSPKDFVGELADYVFGDELTTGTLTGKVSNASKNKNKGEVHKLDTKKIAAIRSN